MNSEARRALLNDVRGLVEASGFETLRLTVGQDHFLRLVLDHPARRVTVEDTTRMNVRIRKGLAARGYDMDTFQIEVESPGADRALIEPKHYVRHVGERVRIVRRGEGLTQRVVTGDLTAADERGCVLKIKGKDPLSLPYAEISEARLDPELPF
jgi:ribosome maturation factor RimP